MSALKRASIRRQVRIKAPAEAAWELVGDPARLAEWFPGIASCAVEGDLRTIVTGAGLTIPERVVTIDPLQRRFQYAITASIVREHLSTIDVVDLEDGSCLAIYGVDAEPSLMALVIGGAGGNALCHLRDLLEGAG